MDASIFIPSELFAPAESSSFKGSVSLPTLAAGPDLYHFAEPLAWHVDVSNVGDALVVSGTVEGRGETACARCLEDVVVDFQGEVEGCFLLDEGREAPEDLDDDEFEVLAEDHVIDLMPLMQAALLVAAPLVALCDEECKGLCPSCGANLNDGPCACARPSDDGISPDNPFAVLKDYHFDAEP